MNSFETSEQLRTVYNWMQDFQQETPPQPCIPSREICKLRFMLIMEELMELANAMGIRLDFDWSQVTFEDEWRDQVAVLDALTDLDVVVKGTNVAFGMHKDLLAFREVMRSNFSKRWSKEEVDAFKVKDFNNTSGFKIVESHVQPGRFIVMNESGKVIKSPSYSKALLANFL